MSLVQALAWVCRRLLRRPISAAGIVLTLMIGIAISVSMFSILHGVVLRALPYPDADRIVTLHGENLELGVSRALLTPAEAFEALESVPGFEHTAVTGWGGFTYTGDSTPRIVEALSVTEDYFSVFGVLPALGRTLNAEDVADFRRVVVLNHAAWLDLTGGDPSLIGRVLSFSDGWQFELVGVLPEAFGHPSRAPRMYHPMPISVIGAAGAPGYLDMRVLEAVGRLAAGTPLALADAGLQARLAAMHDAHGLDRSAWRLRPVALLDDLLGDLPNVLFAIFAVAMLVLLIACATAASLVSIRLEQRKSELALRRALGASDARVAADVALELLVLAALAALGGVGLAALAVHVLAPLAADNLPRAESIRVDTATLLFAAAATAASVLVSGALPLWQALRRSPRANLGGGTAHTVHGGSRIGWLPSAGIGLSTVALIAALALSVSLIRLANLDPGFRTENIVALQVFRSGGAELTLPQFVQRALEELRAVPGVRDVAAVRSPPLDFSARFLVELEAQHALGAPLPVKTQRASAGYHGFLGIPILRGRDISDQDTADSPHVTVINETLARRVFGTADPLGRSLTVAVDSGPRSFEVVGIAADTRNVGLRVPPEAELVMPIEQLPQFPYSVTLLIDAPTHPPNWLRTLEEAVWRVDPNQPIYRRFALTADLDAQLRDARFFALAAGAFAGLALVLGAAGVNAVIAATQRRRTREIGLRLALGATPRRAARLILGRAARIVTLGLTGGSLLAVPGWAWLRSQLFGLDDGTFWMLLGVTALVLSTVGVAAAGWPAWRASRIAPMEALRYE